MHPIFDAIEPIASSRTLYNSRLVRMFVGLLPIVAPAAVLLTDARPALGESVVETRLRALEPCSGLRTSRDVLGVPVEFAVDKLERVSLSRAEVNLDGDRVTLVFAGGLTCRTSDEAVIPGNASVDVVAETAMTLNNCTIGHLE